MDCKKIPACRNSSLVSSILVQLATRTVAQMANSNDHLRYHFAVLSKRYEKKLNFYFKLGIHFHKAF